MRGEMHVNARCKYTQNVPWSGQPSGGGLARSVGKCKHNSYSVTGSESESEKL